VKKSSRIGETWFTEYLLIEPGNKNFSSVLDTIHKTVETHPNHKRSLAGQSETILRYVFAHRDDSNREMMLTVLAFDVPT